MGELSNKHTTTMYLLQTSSELNSSGVPRLHALPGQFLPNGEVIDPSLYVQSPTTPRLNNPIGTIFECEYLQKNTTPTTKTDFYGIYDSEKKKEYPLIVKSNP